MADLSLDDFIKQKNVTVQIRNNPFNKGPAQKRNPQGANPKFQAKGKFSANPVQRTFDARSKLGPKVVVDARNQLATKKNRDARNKIVQKQVQKGTFDARSKLKKQVPKANGKPRHNNMNINMNVMNNPPMPLMPQPITRTLSNPPPLVTPTQRGDHVAFTGNSLKITRKGMGQKKPSIPKLQQDSSAVPIIQIRNDRYQQQPQIVQPPQHPTWLSSNQRLQQQSRPNNNSQYSSSSHQQSITGQQQQPFIKYSTKSSSQQQQQNNQRRYQDLDNPDYHQASSKPQSVQIQHQHRYHHQVQDMPKFNISSLKSVEAAGMRPVVMSSSRQAAPLTMHHRAPPGAATLSAKQPAGGSAGVTRQLVSNPLKRQRQPAAAPPTVQAVGGPLRLGRGGPGLQVGIGEVSPPKRSRGTLPPQPQSQPPIEITHTDLDDGTKYLSPIQGFRVVVTNLFNRVTQDDIIELFGVVGPLKKARLLKSGSAEVVYSIREDAVKAVQKYHGRELDGQPMYVKMTTPSTAVVKVPGGQDPDITGEALKLYKKPSSLGALPKGPIEVPTIHRALFKVGPPAPNKSVKFTVKI